MKVQWLRVDNDKQQIKYIIKYKKKDPHATFHPIKIVIARSHPKRNRTPTNQTQLIITPN